MRWFALAGVGAVVTLTIAACDAPSVDPPPAVTLGGCTNGARDPDENGADCGGACEKACDGEACSSADACASGKCESGRCGASPGKTCGIGLPNLCTDGETCAQDGDCSSDFCEANKCAPPAANVHEDGRRNGGETGTDCGGTAAPAKTCPAGEPCKTSDDCQSVCNASVCAEPSATDGKKNNGESDIDCGGANAPPCTVGKVCATNADCQLKACSTSKACAQPSASDATLNGGETDVDCGGQGVTEGSFTYSPPRCKEGQTCAIDADCNTKTACAPTSKKCVTPSCATAETAGIVTCGAKEVADPTKVHETCCKSLVLPTRSTRRLDKYEITSGRFRTFIQKVGPNIRQWVANYRAANPSSQLAQLAAVAPNTSNIFPATKTGPLGLVAHLSFDIDNYNGVRGCYNGNGNYGANTYWQDDMDQAQYGLPSRHLPRSESDTKPMNCVMPIMFAAFCAWDGGAELALHADYMDAWGATTYPWSNTDILRPNYNWCNGRPGNGGWNCQNTALGGGTGIFYAQPPNTNEQSLEVWIAAPGRFVNDASALKGNGESWMDLYGNMAEYTGNFTASADDFCDFSGAPAAGATLCTRTLKAGNGTRYTNIGRVGLVGSAWEGHQYGKTSGTNAWYATGQYGKFGGRCVRSLP